MHNDNLEAAIQDELRMIEAIKQNSRRLTAPLMRVLFQTFAPPMLVFALFATVGSLVIQNAERVFPGAGLSVTLYVVGLFATIYLMWRAWRWSEARFGGVALLRRLQAVTRAVLQIELAIEKAKARPSPDPADVARIAALTQTAWDLYTNAMQAYGLEVD